MGCDYYFKPGEGGFPEPSILCYICGENMKWHSKKTCQNENGEVPVTLSWKYDSCHVRER